MSETKVLQAPNLVRLAGSRIDGEAKTVWLAFDSSDGRRFAIELTAEAAAATVATTLQVLGKLRPMLPPDRVPTPTLEGRTMELAMSPEGEVGLKMNLANGAELVLQLPRSEIATFRDQMIEAASLVSPETKH